MFVTLRGAEVPMGAWGPAIFSDDLACDVRDHFRELIGDGLAVADATQQVLREYAAALDDLDECPVVWIALAATQWKCGRLEDDTKAKALDIIDSGTGLALWEEQGPKLLSKRKAALQKLREQLVSPQPPPKRIPKRFRNSTDLAVGDVISYRLCSGGLVLFKVVGHHTDRGGTVPEIVLLGWRGSKAPSRWRMALMRPMSPITDHIRPCQMMIGALKEGDYPADRITLVGRNLPVRGSLPCYGMLWRFLDQWLDKHYGLR